MLTQTKSFFSTQFVSQKSGMDGKPTLNIAENWWLYVAISAPLTIVTIGVWYAWISWPWKPIRRWHRTFSMKGALHDPPKSDKAAYLGSASDILAHRNRLPVNAHRLRSQSTYDVAAASEKIYDV